MSGAVALSAILSGLILTVLALRAWYVMRIERGRPRGSPPGPGQHVLRSDYFSGGGGGGQSVEYTIPRDPEAYARLFVPKTSDKKDR